MMPTPKEHMRNTPEGNAFLLKLENEHEYRKYTGPNYIVIGAHQFVMLTILGLREYNTLLDVGCGSLSGGRFFIPYLNKGNYYAVEPNPWLYEDVIQAELSANYMRLRGTHITAGHEIPRTWPRFSFILAHSIFSHAPVRIIKHWLDQIIPHMHKDTRFVGTYYAGYEDYAGDEWIYPRGVFYTQETMTRIFAEKGLRFVHTPTLHPETQMWFTATLMGRFE